MTVSKLTTSTDVYEVQQKTNEIIDGYLPLTGGTLTSNLFLQGANSKLFGFKITESGNNIDVGWDWSTTAGSGAAFRSSAHAAAGNFIFFARSSVGTKQLVGTPGGSLKWDNQEILRANSSLDATKLTGTINTARIPIDNSTITVNGSGKLQATGSSSSDIFIATYGTTTYADVLAAYNAGKTIICIWEFNTGQYTATSSYTFTNSDTFTFYFTEYYILRAPFLTSAGWGYYENADKFTFQQVGDWATGTPSTTSTASSTKPSVVVENYLSGTSGYICFSDKLCIQWGHHGNSKNAISLLVTMADTDYALLSTRTASGSGTSYTKTTTTITPGQAWAATWMVIGYHA